MNNADNYSDIINMPHPVSKKHRPMEPIKRASQFAPFAALTGYEAVIAETGRITEKRPELTEEETAILAEKLNRLAEEIGSNPETEVVHFVQDLKKEGGKMETFRGRLKRIDGFGRKIVFTDGTEIAFGDICGIK